MADYFVNELWARKSLSPSDAQVRSMHYDAVLEELRVLLLYQGENRPEGRVQVQQITLRNKGTIEKIRSLNLEGMVVEGLLHNDVTVGIRI